MNTSADISPRVGRVVQACSLAVCALGVVALLAWQFETAGPLGSSARPTFRTIKADTAACFCLCGVALLLRRREGGAAWRRLAARAAAVLVAAVGAATLLEQVVTRGGGRMAPAGAVLFIFAGAALWLLDARRLVWLAQVLAATALAMAMLSLVGYAYGVRGAYPFAPFTAVAVQAAVAFALLGVGLLMARPSVAIAGLITRGVGGSLARRLLPHIVLTPVVLGAVSLAGWRNGFYGVELAAAFVAVSTILTLTVFVTLNARHLNRLAHSALTDALTGVGNRALFDHRLPAEMSLARRWGRPLSCLMVDADRFKDLNDAYGHAFGDQVLRTIGRLLLAGSRREDVVCRYGGEEFVLLLPNTPAAGAKVVAERIREAVAGYAFAYRGKRVQVTCSIGVSAFGGGGDAGLVERADAALYEAKQAGRNCVAVAGADAAAAARAPLALKQTA